MSALVGSDSSINSSALASGGYRPMCVADGWTYALSSPHAGSTGLGNFDVDRVQDLGLPTISDELSPAGLPM